MPDCQYPTEVYFTTNLPPYMQHDVDLERIVFPELEQVLHAGFYNAKMGVRVYIPTDYTYDTILIRDFKAAFSVEIVDPCPQSTITPFTIDDVQVRVFVGPTQR